MKGFIRAGSRGVWHIPERRGLSPKIIYAHCGWVFNDPERSDGSVAPVCQKCKARRGEA